MLVKDIIDNNDSYQEKILQLDNFFGFIPKNEKQSIERTLKVSEILSGRWNVPVTTTGYSGRLNSDEKEDLIHYFYEQKLKKKEYE